MEYSHKDFTGQHLSHRKDMSNQVIIGSCFSQEVPNSQVFPSNMKGTNFINCNLDNCIIPKGNIISGGVARSFQIQNDLEDWVVSKDGTPLEPVNIEVFKDNNLSIDPLVIPKTKKSQSVILEAAIAREKAVEKATAEIRKEKRKD